MKRLFPILFALFCAHAWAVTPIVIQYFGGPNAANTGFAPTTATTINVPLARAATAGDTLVWCFEYSAGSGWAVKTDAGAETFTLGVNGAGDGTTLACYYFINLAGGETTIAITHTSGSPTYVGGEGVEVNNVTSHDAASTCTTGTSVAQAASTTATSGTTGTLTTGDLIVAFNFQYQTPQVATNFAPVTHANITWQLYGTELQIAQAMMVGQYTTTTAFTPSMTQTSNQTWSMCSDAFKTGTSGASGLPAGEYLTGFQAETILGGGGNPSNMEITPMGNTVVVTNATAFGAYFTTVTSTPSITWTIASRCFDSSDTTEVDAFYATGLTPGTTYNISMTLSNGSAGDSALVADDFADATTPNTGSAGTCNTGTFSATNGNLNTSLTTGGGAATNTAFVPTSANGIVVSADSVDFDTNIGTTTSGAFVNNGWFSGATQTGNTAYYENDGALTYPHSSTSGVAFIYTIAASPPNTSTDVDLWSNLNLDVPLAPSASTAIHHKVTSE